MNEPDELAFQKWLDCPAAMWCIRQADGDWMTFVNLAAMFLIHPGRDEARWN